MPGAVTGPAVGALRAVLARAAWVGVGTGTPSTPCTCTKHHANSNSYATEKIWSDPFFESLDRWIKRLHTVSFLFGVL